MEESNIPPNDNELSGKSMIHIDDNRGTPLIYERNPTSITKEKMYSWILDMGDIKTDNYYGIICGVVTAINEQEAAKVVAKKLMNIDPGGLEFLWSIHNYNQEQTQKYLESKDDIDGSVPIYVPKYMMIDPEVIQVSELTLANNFAIIGSWYDN